MKTIRVGCYEFNFVRADERPIHHNFISAVDTRGNHLIGKWDVSRDYGNMTYTKLVGLKGFGDGYAEEQAMNVINQIAKCVDRLHWTCDVSDMEVRPC